MFLSYAGRARGAWQKLVDSKSVVRSVAACCLAAAKEFAVSFAYMGCRIGVLGLLMCASHLVPAASRPYSPESWGRTW